MLNHLCNSQFHLRPAPPPPPGYCGAFVSLVSPGDNAFANFALPGGRAFANPRAIHELFDTHAVSYQNVTTEGFTGKKVYWLICQGRE